MKALKPILIVWKDAVSFDPWHDLGEPLLPNTVVSVGFLIAKEKTHVQIALNVDLINDNMSCVMTIPNGMIEKIIPLMNRKTRKDLNGILGKVT